MLELRDYLAITVDQAAAQWRSMLERTDKKRQDDFTPVETLLSFGLGQLGNISPSGNVNIPESDPNASKLAAIAKRRTSSIAAKLANLDGRRPHGAKYEQQLWNTLSNDPSLYMHLYETAIRGARQIGIEEDRLPDFLGLESKTLEAVVEADRVSTADLREAIDGEVRQWELENPGSNPIDTERSMLGTARIGQQQFARRVLGNCGFVCVFCGLGFRDSGLPASRMLIASHIKSWRESNNSERLDYLNGIAACPTHDAAFDSFLLTVSSDMKIVLGPALARAVAADFAIAEHFGPGGVAPALILSDMSVPPLRAYLAWHSQRALTQGRG